MSTVITSDDDALTVLQDVMENLDEPKLGVEEGEYIEAAELLDEFIEKLQAVKAWAESKVEGSSTEAPLAVKQNQEGSGGKVSRSKTPNRRPISRTQALHRRPRKG